MSSLSVDIYWFLSKAWEMLFFARGFYKALQFIFGFSEEVFWFKVIFSENFEVLSEVMGGFDANLSVDLWSAWSKW